MNTVSDPPATPAPAAPAPRLAWLDAARGGALLAMGVFHLVFDLEMFGLLPRGTAFAPPWSGLSTATAGSFLFLAGVALHLAHGTGLRARAFARRLVRIAGAALLVSAATYAADPGSFVFFGILHAIALFSVLGLGLLRLPGWALAAVALALFMLGPALSHPVFDHPALLWTGLSPRTPLTMDFEPLFPWGAPFVAGIFAGRLLPAAMLRPAAPRGSTQRALAWAGRHSLLIYLLHQPVLIGLIWLGLQILR